MSAWFESMDDRLWLHPDGVGALEARFIRKILHLRRGDEVLDAPCGAGRLSIHLAAAGCRVHGLELRAAFVKRARRRFQDEGLKGAFRTMDIRKLDTQAAYHGIVNWTGSFGYFSDRENAALVSSFARALLPGGRLAIEQADREWVLRHFKPVIEADGLRLHNRWDAHSQRLITVRRGPGLARSGERSSMRLYTPTQFRRLLESQGLLVEAIHRPVAFDAYGPGLPRIVVVARRPLTRHPARSC